MNQGQFPIAREALPPNGQASGKRVCWSQQQTPDLSHRSRGTGECTGDISNVFGYIRGIVVSKSLDGTTCFAVEWATIRDGLGVTIETSWSAPSGG